MLQLLADDSLPIIILLTVAIVNGWLSIDYILIEESRPGVCLYTPCWDASGPAGRARDGMLHGYVSALVCSHLAGICGPFGQIVCRSAIFRCRDWYYVMRM